MSLPRRDSLTADGTVDSKEMRPQQDNSRDNNENTPSCMVLLGMDKLESSNTTPVTVGRVLQTPQESAASHLERLCELILAALNSHQLHRHQFGSLFTPDIEGFLPHSHEWYVSTREEYLRNYEHVFERLPDYRCELLNMSTDVDENAGEGRVWCWMRVTEDRNVFRENVTIMHFRREGGDCWLVHKQEGMRGLSGT